jgi:hypothetical protein
MQKLRGFLSNFKQADSCQIIVINVNPGLIDPDF